MLILTRRIGETIMIGDNVTITVLGIQGGQTRIGIDAPTDIKVHREEIYRRIQQEQNGQAPFHYQEPDEPETNGQEYSGQRPVSGFSNQPLPQRVHTPVISVKPRSRFSMPATG